jgi:hypothetical protein
MSNIGKPERQTQERVNLLFQNELGYRNLGDWTDRADILKQTPGYSSRFDGGEGGIRTHGTFRYA